MTNIVLMDAWKKRNRKKLVREYMLELDRAEEKINRPILLTTMKKRRSIASDVKRNIIFCNDSFAHLPEFVY